MCLLVYHWIRVSKIATGLAFGACVHTVFTVNENVSIIMRKSRLIYPLIFICSLWVTSAEASALREAATKRDCSLRATPSAKAQSLESVDSGTLLQVGERKGLWLKIEVPSEGWLKLTEVKFTETISGGGLSGLASGREATGNSVASSGARGLSSEQLETSEPDFEQLEKLKEFKSTIDKEQFFESLEIREIPELKKSTRKKTQKNKRR